MRACVRAKLRVRDDSSVAGAGGRNLWGGGAPPAFLRAGEKCSPELFEYRKMISKASGACFGGVSAHAVRLSIVFNIVRQ